MSADSIQAKQALATDPVISHFSVFLEEDAEAGRWELLGRVPTEGIKRRAGVVARRHCPSRVWLVNNIQIQPDESVRVAKEGAFSGVA